MRMLVPPDCGAVSHAGQVVEIGDDRCVNVDGHAAKALLAHGFTRFDGEPRISSESQAPGSAQKFDALNNDIDRLNRRELFAFLKARSVSVSLPVTNEALRAMARDSAGSATFEPSSGDAP